MRTNNNLFHIINVDPFVTFFFHPGPYRHGTSCYIYDATSRNWESAVQSCANQGYELVSVEDNTEMSYLYTVLTDLGGGWFVTYKQVILHA